MRDKHVIQFPATLHNLKNTTINEVIIGFNVQKEFSEPAQDLIGKIGHEYMVFLVDMTDVDKTEKGPNPLRDRFLKKFHLMIDEYAEIAGLEKEKAKDIVRGLMIENGMIKESTKEASFTDLAKSCNIIQKLIDEHGKTS